MLFVSLYLVYAHCIFLASGIFQQPRPAKSKQRLTDSRVINAVCEPSYSVCTLHLSRAQRLLKNAPTRDASPPLVVALCALLQVKFVKHIAAAAKLVDDEEHVADIHVDATLQGGVELEVGTETLDVAVEGQTNEFAFGVEHTRTRVATSDVVV